MKQTFLTLLLALLLGMPGVEALAYDIAVNNADGVTIYYNYVDNSTALEVTHNGSLGRSYKGDVVIPQSVNYGGKNYSVTSIGMGAFYMCSGVTSVTIPSSVTSIGEEAFNHCSLSKINVEAETPPTLGRLAFSNYDAMVYVPRSSKEQYRAAWSGFSNFYAANDIAAENAQGVTIYYNYLNNKSALEVTYRGGDASDYPERYTGSIVIPEAVDYKGKTYPVTGIGDGAFYFCSGLTGVTLPSSLTSIGEYAFYGCTGLKKLFCNNSKLTSLDVSSCTALTYLDCGYNQLTSLDVSKNTALTSLDCDCNQLTSLDVSKNTALKTLKCSYNQLTSLDVSKNTALKTLKCSDNQLTSLDVSKNTALTELDCDWNQLTSLDVSKNTALTHLYCYGNQLTSLDVSKNTALTELYCYNNPLTSLDVSKNTALEELGCWGNQLTSLDVSKNTALTDLYCYNNQLTTLDVSNNTALKYLTCSYNQLTSLDVSKNTALTGLICFNNQIRGAGMATLIENLPTVTGGNFFVYNTDGTDGNRITTVQVAAAKAKGWEVQTAGWVDYPGVDPGIAIDATNFPDEKFRTYVSSKCDTDKDTYLSEDEIAAVTSINVNNKNISDLKGIEYFTALKELYCGSNQLTSLDVSKNTALTSLICDYNQLTSLDASGCTALTTLGCSYNQLTSLDVSGCTALTTLYCENNQLTSLDVSKNTALTLLYCHINQLTSLNVSKNTALTYLACFLNQIQGSGMATLVNNLPIVASGNGNFEVYDTDGTDGNRITTVQVAAAKAKGWDVKTADGGDYAGVDPGIAIDATNFPDEKFREYVSTYCDKDKDTYLSDEEIAAVKGIYALEMSITNLKGIEYFTALTYLACYSNKLTSLDVSKNTALTGLECNDNLLTTLDVSKNTALTYLTCDYNQLTTLDVSKNTALTVLACNGNKLTSLDVSKNTALIHLQCYDTQLASLDVSKNAALTELWCGRNQLTSLDVSKNTALTELRCYNDQIQGAGMATLVNGLPTVTSGKFYVYNIKGTEGNQITTVQVAAAKAKGWDVKTADGDDYPGINIPADANGDGEVNATDVATVRDYILGLDPKPFSLESANLNGDSTVNIADLAKLIQLLTE